MFLYKNIIRCYCILTKGVIKFFFVCFFRFLIFPSPDRDRKNEK